MSEAKRKHYRNVFKSDHLSTFDLEDFQEQGILLEFTITRVEQHQATKVAGKTIAANIAHFKEGIKPLVLNATNSATMAKICGSSYVDDWKNVEIELFILKNIRFGKETVSGVRIKDTPPKSISEHDVKIIKGKVAIVTSQAELNQYYSSLTTKEKTHPEVMKILKEKQIDLKQQG